MVGGVSLARRTRQRCQHWVRWDCKISVQECAKDTGLLGALHSMLGCCDVSGLLYDDGPSGRTYSCAMVQFFAVASCAACPGMAGDLQVGG